VLYKIFNGPAPTTASQVAVTTGTAIKTLLQVKPGATQIIKVREWGISFDGSAAATPGIVELCVTDVAATVTAHAAGDIHKYDSEALAAGDPTTNIFAVGTTSTGYTASGEGTVGSVRQGDVQQIAPTNQLIYQFPLGVAFVVQAGEFMRIRVKFAAAINAICYVLVEA
jgi:zona occludens toxin (predicted ATPase)